MRSEDKGAIPAFNSALRIPRSALPGPGGWSRTSSSTFSAWRFNRVSFTEQYSVPRQGIEPCVCRLKAGGFAIEACEVARQFRGLESNQRRPPSKGGIRTSTESPGPKVTVAEAGIEPATSTFRGWHQLPALNPRHRSSRPVARKAGLHGRSTESTSSGGRNRTYKLRFNRAPPYHSAPHRCV